MPEITAPLLRSPCNNIIIVPHFSLFVQFASILKNVIGHCYEALRTVGVALRAFLGLGAVGVSLLQRNALFCLVVFVLRLGQDSAGQKSKNCAFIETRSAENLQRTAPWAQTPSTLGTTLLVGDPAEIGPDASTSRPANGRS
jgi:hypothetical protein